MSLPRGNETIADWNKRRLAEMLADKPVEVYVARNGVWGAKLENGADVYAYEKLDYHAGCREFLESLIAAGVKVINYSNMELKGSVKPKDA